MTVLKFLGYAGAAALFLTGAAQAADEYANLHTVAIVSKFDTEFGWWATGYTSFDTDHSAVSKIKLDTDPNAFAVKAAADDLSGAFTVLPAGIDSSLLGGDALSPTALAAIQALPAASRPDVYVVIIPTMAFTGLDWQGIYLTHSKGIFDARTAIWESYVVRTYDSHTGKQIDHAHVSETSGFDCDDSLWAPLDKLTAQQRSDADAAFRKLIDGSLLYALYNANLFPSETYQAIRSRLKADPSGKICQSFL